jgi:hypothetical protein
MPLLDHFHPPLSTTRTWSSFHARWAVAIADSLNATLPSPRFLAETEVSIGREFKTDVVEYEQPPGLGNGENGGVAVATYAPPQAARTVAVTFPEEVAVRVYDLSAGRTLVGVIELVSPANKDRPDNRRAFAMKCATFLHDRIGLIVADIVSEYHANLHREVLGLLGDPHTGDLPADCHLYAVAYRPVLRNDQGQLDLWPVSLGIGQPLPVLPLALRGSFTVPIDLEATYTEARQRCHL